MKKRNRMKNKKVYHSWRQIKNGTLKKTILRFTSEDEKFIRDYVKHCFSYPAESLEEYLKGCFPNTKKG